MIKKIFYIGLIGQLLLSVSGCKKFLEVGPPVSSVSSENVYTTDATAIASVTGVYARMSNDFFLDGFPAISIYAGLSADELRNYSGDNNAVRVATYQNKLTALPTGNFRFWTAFYPYVFYSNATIEGLNDKNSKVSALVKQQLLGEAYFMRAFTYFYLTSLYGDVPLVLTTDWTQSSQLGRTSKAEVYNQMVADLIQAKSLLNENYVDATLLKATTERIRPNRSAAAALLARVYLYKAEYANAEAESTAVIGNSNYGLITLANTFLKNSKETIWALQPVGSAGGANQNSLLGSTFVPSSSTVEVGSSFPVYLNDTFISSFEPGDNRKTAWVGSIGAGATIAYYPNKYKIGTVVAATAEYSIQLRFAEQYLIRAEARAQLNNLSGAQADLNAIRNRSGLGNTGATTQSAILNAIDQERKVELFTEWGDRWFNMQRRNTIDAIMPGICLAKGTTWNSYQKLYPLVSSLFINNPLLVQNPGYQ